MKKSRLDTLVSDQQLEREFRGIVNFHGPFSLREALSHALTKEGVVRGSLLTKNSSLLC